MAHKHWGSRESEGNTSTPTVWDPQFKVPCSAGSDRSYGNAKPHAALIESQSIDLDRAAPRPFEAEDGLMESPVCGAAASQTRAFRLRRRLRMIDACSRHNAQQRKKQDVIDRFLCLASFFSFSFFFFFLKLKTLVISLWFVV